MNSSQITTAQRIKAIVGGSIGNLVEWYDWYAYAAFAIYFSHSFFPNSSMTAQLLNTAGIFAVGFLMRPVGGWLFGSIADKIGRKRAMTLSVLLMSFGSLLIALTPTYKTIGVLAPALLLIARLLQGLSVGGEYGVSATYLSEMATSDRRGFYSSFQYVTLIGGQLIALGIQLILQKLLLTEAQLEDWGWRIPFVIGAILSVVALYLRANLHETEAFENKKNLSENKKGSITELLKHPKALLTVIGLTLGGTLAFYTYTTYMQKFLVNTVHLTKEESTLISFISLFIFACLQPVFGALSDKIGRRPLLLSFGILGTIFTYPLLNALSTTTSMWGAFFLIMAALIIVSGYTSINAVVKAELFPSEVRALGVGLPYALTVAIFGGTAEYIALWFKQENVEHYFYWYITACIFFSFIVYATMKDTKKTSTLDRD
ncbi:MULTISPECIES: MFS transporter [Chryseobacterium]|jgi:MHS family alpha-ketoglutarate permease-like MFS transporter|uniref:MHS family alpha-ketoglutarate permease-like MFS transporter n=1 Tax=Chryseobacterium geocarposphaerae TaxID=1416776 RepID=A0ABU1LCQ4_9FLAO|nr:MULTISPECIES: MFS transporter [Chryseobacterium]ALR31377.1 alpha-ketoglutarate transporter [Chryseobacterium sp. IHB B 17019]MDR6404469.1 MHS family alpha-ketoglutarate permease-like MFS transporter [Chryseobacterium geocarposphaerae]MDR6698299.1 MHS family alpha-ketoglutarate permease-like MFS transporter [Chryseobacterium ginsenosidimutans]